MWFSLYYTELAILAAKFLNKVEYYHFLNYAVAANLFVQWSCNYFTY